MPAAIPTAEVAIWSTWVIEGYSKHDTALIRKPVPVFRPDKGQFAGHVVVQQGVSADRIDQSGAVCVDRDKKKKGK